MSINKIVSNSLYNVKKFPYRSSDIIYSAPINKQSMTLSQAEALKARVLAAFPPKTENEMLAIKMNQQAIHSIKYGISKRFRGASIEDLVILQDDNIRKYVYQNPNSGNLYHLIHKGRDKQGNILLKALDSDGAFVSDLCIKPKKIVIVDTYSPLRESINPVSHGEKVEKYLLANNPCVEIYRCNIPSDDNSNMDCDNILSAFENILKMVESGHEFNYINCSFAQEKNLKEVYSLVIDNKMGVEKTKAIKQIFASGINVNKYSEKFNCLTGKLLDKNVRTIQSGGNGGAQCYSIDLAFSKSEGVGGLDYSGKIMRESASRLLDGAWHYEQGRFQQINRSNGVNVTNTTGVDLLFPQELPELIRTGAYNDLLATQKELKLCEKARHIPEELFQKVYKRQDLPLIYSSVKSSSSSNPIYLYKGYLFTPNGEIADFPKMYAGTSFSTPIRTAKLALNDSLKGYLP